jgi:hypothetical protein
MRRYFLLLVSLAVLSCSTVNRYYSLPEVKAWETDIQKFELLDKNETYSKEAILFAGSSSIRLWATLEKDMAPYPVIQRGYGGAKLSDFDFYADRIFRQHMCKAIVIFIANDITGSKEDKSPEEVASLFKNLLKIIRKSHPLTPVFWIAITPTGSRWPVWNEIQKANALIENICKQGNNTYFIRTDYAFLDDNGLPLKEYFIEDQLHLNELGYEIWTKIIKKDLDLILNK